MKCHDVMLVSCKRRSVTPAHRLAMANYTDTPSVTSGIMDDHYVLFKRMVAWAQTWERIGYFEHDVSNYHDLFCLVVIECWRFRVRVRATDFHGPSSVKGVWPPCRLSLTWPSESQADPCGPWSSTDDGLFADFDLAAHWRSVVSDLPGRESVAMQQQVRSNQHRKIGLPLRRISRDLVALPLHAEGPVFLVGEGRPKSSHQCSAGKFGHELDSREKGGLGHRYCADVDRARTMMETGDEDPKNAHNLQMKKVRVLNAKGNRVWEGTLAAFQKRGLGDGETLAASQASKRRVRAHATSQYSRAREALTEQSAASSSAGSGKRPRPPQFQ